MSRCPECDYHPTDGKCYCDTKRAEAELIRKHVELIHRKDCEGPIALVPELNINLGLASMMARYHAERLRSGDWQAPHAEQVQHVCGEFLAFVGNPPVTEVGRAHVHGFKQSLVNPTAPNLGRGPRSVATVNRYLSILGSFFKWAMIAGYCDLNPVEGQRVKQKCAARDQRAAFTDEEMTGIFEDHFCWGGGVGRSFKVEAMKKSPAHYWIPTIMRYSGMRPEEIAQLRYGDFCQQEGAPVSTRGGGGGFSPVACFDLRSTELNIKTEAGRRLVPIHSKIAGGIAKLRHKAYMNGFHPGCSLFPELYGSRAICDRMANTPSRWFNRQWLRSHCGITDPKKVLYSLRHTVATRLMQADVPDGVIAQLLGHAPVGETIGRYGKSFKVEQLRVAVEHLY